MHADAATDPRCTVRGNGAWQRCVATVRGNGAWHGASRRASHDARCIAPCARRVHPALYPVVNVIGGAGLGRGGVGGAHQARRGRGDRMADVELARQLLQREDRLLPDRCE
jgi:hypothetical protein